MITVTQATDHVLQNTTDYSTETVQLSDAVGRVLAEPLVADRDFPPFDRVTMDGIAIRHEAYANGRRQFKVTGMQAAGTPQMKLDNPDQCLEVMTGAICPEGADTVIRYEDLIIAEGVATINLEALEPGKNVHDQGSDRERGELIAKPNRLISAGEIGVAATVGKANLLVKKLPRVVLISTGDEIVEIEAAPQPHQIRSSNVFAIRSLLSKWHISAERLHLPDRKEATIDGLREALEHFDVLIMSGGVSMGKFDFVPKALESLGVEQLFHKVQQRPGKPFWFGKAPNGAVVFALPGNPVSAFMCTVRYVEPWLRQSLGLSAFATQNAILAEDFNFKPNLTYFLQVQVESDANGHLLARPLPGGGSGDLANLTVADGFLELPQGRDLYEKGEVFRFWKYR